MLALGYNNERVATLLILVAPSLPFDCVAKLPAALVLLAVSAVKVVVGVIVVVAKIGRHNAKMPATTSSERACMAPLPGAAHSVCVNTLEGGQMERTISDREPVPD